MKVKIKRDTIVRFGKGSVIEVTDKEGKRLISFGNAEKVKETPKKKETKKKKAAE